MEDIRKFTGGAEAPESSIVKLEVPEIAENGNTVPLSVSVDSPMTADNYVKRVILLAEKNPNPGVATFHFSPRSGVAEASTRMRLATTQNVIAVAELSDGSFHMTKSQVKVTIGGCGG
jgi:sulfur-oxidizing protein SoxY